MGLVPGVNVGNTGLQVPRTSPGDPALAKSQGGSQDPASAGAGTSPSDSPTSATPTESSSTTPAPSSEAPAPSPAEPPPPQPSKPEVPKPADPPAPPRSDSSLAGQIVAMVNQERAKLGCSVAVESHLTTAAQKHTDDMSDRGYFSHTSPEGTTFDQRIRNAGYSKPGAENIAKGTTTAAQTMQMWMNSEGHRANIQNCKLTKIGVGVATDGWLWTQDFGY